MMAPCRPNRAARRAARKPAKGQPVTVSRSIPLTVLQHGDGTGTVVNHETDEPCYDCPCCVLWARSLDALATAIKEHDAEMHGHFGPVPTDHSFNEVSCLVCAMLAGQADG